MKRYADIISGSFIAFIGVVFLIETRNIQALMKMEFGPKIMPRILSVGLIFFGVTIAASGWIQSKNRPGAVQSRHLGEIRTAKVLATAALIIFYVAALQPLGFLVTSVIYLFLQVIVLGGVAKKARLLPYALVSIIVASGINVLFTQVFKVLLPAGRLW